MIVNSASAPAATAEITESRAEIVKAALVAGLLGGVLVFATGFASPAVLHNAAHDSRHAMNFPCH